MEELKMAKGGSEGDSCCGLSLNRCDHGSRRAVAAEEGAVDGDVFAVVAATIKAGGDEGIGRGVADF